MNPIAYLKLLTRRDLNCFFGLFTEFVFISKAETYVCAEYIYV